MTTNNHNCGVNDGARRPNLALRRASKEDLRQLPADLNLEDLCRQDRYTQIDNKLAEVAAGAARQPDWLEAWQHSTRGRQGLVGQAEEASPEERLDVWRLVRASGLLPADASFYLVAGQIEFLAEIRLIEMLEEVDLAVEAVCVRHGLAEWRAGWRSDAARWEGHREKYPQDWDRLYLGQLTGYGEVEMATLYRADRETFLKRSARGAGYFRFLRGV
jgi:hypothetical protein